MQPRSQGAHAVPMAYIGHMTRQMAYLVPCIHGMQPGPQEVTNKCHKLWHSQDHKVRPKWVACVATIIRPPVMTFSGIRQKGLGSDFGDASLGSPMCTRCVRNGPGDDNRGVRCHISWSGRGGCPWGGNSKCPFKKKKNQSHEKIKKKPHKMTQRCDQFDALRASVAAISCVRTRL